MSEQNTNSQRNSRNSYKRITEGIRMQIIDRNINKQEVLKTVAQDMKINISTAKAIIKVYQREGRVGKKQKRDKVVNVIQTFSFYYVNGDKVQKLEPTVIQQQKKLVKVYQSSIDEELKQNARLKAEQILERVIENKREQIQRQPVLQSYSTSTQQYGNLFPTCGMPYFSYGYPY